MITRDDRAQTTVVRAVAPATARRLNPAATYYHTLSADDRVGFHFEHVVLWRTWLRQDVGCTSLYKCGWTIRFEINGSDATGVDFVRERIVRFSSALAMNGGRKICFIDEADYVSQNAQAALRKVIEEYSDNCRYLLAVNNISKLIPAVRSRLMEICFDIAPADRAEVKKRLVERYERKLSAAGIPIDKERLNQIVSIYYPDLRSIANHLEFEFA